MKTVRIATVIATGKQYLVERIHFGNGKPTDPDKVFCWGEVQSFRGLASRHEANKSFLKSAVTVREAPKTEALLNELFQQNIAGRRDAGHVIHTTRKGNVKDYGTPAQIEARRDASDQLMRSLNDAGIPQVLATIARLNRR